MKECFFRSNRRCYNKLCEALDCTDPGPDCDHFESELSYGALKDLYLRGVSNVVGQKRIAQARDEAAAACARERLRRWVG